MPQTKTFSAEGGFTFTIAVTLPGSRPQPIQLVVTSAGPAVYSKTYQTTSQGLPDALAAAQQEATAWAADRGNNTNDHDYLVAQGFSS